MQPGDILEFRRGNTILRGTAEKFASRVFSAATVEQVPSVRVTE